MENKELIAHCKEKAMAWLAPSYDSATQTEVKTMLDNPDKTELIEAFYKDLEFGTGGLRGIMGTGSNRMNIYTVGAATQGLANYLNKCFAGKQPSVVVGHDCRNNSRKFAEITADVFSANGIKVYLFEDMRPTPEISFAIRHLGCQSGVMVTASHNPKEYNGYKAYWEDGAQVLAPHDTAIIDEVNKIKSAADIKFAGDKSLITILGKEMDDEYLRCVKTISIDPQVIARQKDLKIVYTPIHRNTVLYDVIKEEQAGLVSVDKYPFSFTVFASHAYTVGIGVGSHYDIGIYLFCQFNGECQRFCIFGVGRNYCGEVSATYHLLFYAMYILETPKAERLRNKHHTCSVNRSVHYLKVFLTRDDLRVDGNGFYATQVFVVHFFA